MKKYSLMLLLLFVSIISFAQTNSEPSYEELKTQIELQRVKFQEEYIITTDSSQRDSLQKVAYKYLNNILVNNIFPAWYGTTWAFHGHTKVPKKGSIACGYSITTTLNDVGYKIPRIKWAQMESERIIRKLTTDVKRFQNAQMSVIINHINTKGDGLYIVGLDQHVGFISKQGNKLQFIHSNYYKPEIGVMAEPLIGWNPLNSSKYRVIGKILDNTMIEKWITGYKYE